MDELTTLAASEPTTVLGLSDTEGLDFILFEDEATGEEYDTREWGYFQAPIMEIPDAQARRYQVTVPGRDGALDLTDALGGTSYENRELSFRFVFENGNEERYHHEASRIRNLMDGRRFRATLSHDNQWYWTGRCHVEARRMGRVLTSLTVTMDAEPFKRSTTSSYEPWLWDPFSFVDGIIIHQEDVVLDNSTETVELPVDPAASKVTLWLNAGNSGAVQAKMSTERTWHALKRGANTIPEIRMDRAASTYLQLRGTGTVGIEYRLGSL